MRSKDLPKAPAWRVARALQGIIAWVSSVLCPPQLASLAGTTVQCAFLAQLKTRTAASCCSEEVMSVCWTPKGQAAFCWTHKHRGAVVSRWETPAAAVGRDINAKSVSLF